MTIAIILIVVLSTIIAGGFGLRIARTTSDFLVASRSIRPAWNASAISGEYLSAASFLGVAGLIMAYGFDMLWYPVGYTAGYLMLLLLVAAPLRRCGAYTIPDFAEGRLDSAAIRRIATAFVVLIGLFYLLPQLKGAGITLQAAFGTPYWVGVVAVGAMLTANIALGGMKSVTLAQAFLYWVKLTAIAVPAIFLVLHLRAGDLHRLDTKGRPEFERTTVVTFPQSTSFTVDRPTPVKIHGTLNNRDLNGTMTLERGQYRAGGGLQLTFTKGELVPIATGTATSSTLAWNSPLSSAGEGRGHPLFFIYSLMLATFLGTMGLPHILVRFYTNPNGRDARRTTLVVLALIGIFYLFPSIIGALGRLWVPQLYLTGQTDAVVLDLPGAVFHGLLGQAATALVAGGAFAAFMSTSSGLLVSISGALSHDLLRRTVVDFRKAAVLAGIVAILLALRVYAFDINVLVGWAFAIAASSFCPLLVLGIWWRGLTPHGAIAGLIVGGGLSSAAIAVTMTGALHGGWPAALLAQPAAWSVPISFVTMIGVSLATASKVPANVSLKMLTMHAPETLGLPIAP
ncbi:MAG: cation acetate symporter [Actinobacteria bacterium]|nr:cation acetate symporter [Actinomycetota bacterium]MCL6095701.1 cation acetate symporter [Actinomycetota bacterium]